LADPIPENEAPVTITHVSDTARWVAVYRAMESDRPDALFRDPFARQLAGPEGERIVAMMPQGRSMAWAMIVRTAVFDELILGAVAREGITRIVNLAAGLDARPWRLALPPTLTWVDVDFADVLAYKTGIIGGAAPRCRYRTESVDLTDHATRAAFSTRLGAEPERTLFITEGLLIYLAPEQVAELGRDLAAIPGAAYWLTDLANPLLLQWMQRSWGRAVAAGNAPFTFAPAEGTEFFRPLGWTVAEVRWGSDESRRLRREMRLMWLWRILGRLYPRERREQFRRMSASVLLRRAGEAAG
jgi:methyltransferase (TIGR00027 family)